MKCHLASKFTHINKPAKGTSGLITSTTGVLVSLIVCVVLSSFIGTGNAFADYTLSVTSSGALSIDVSPNSNGKGTNIGVDNIEVITDCKAGYNFSISTSVNDNNLYLNGSSSNNTSGKYFTPADGTTALTDATNTWGYLSSTTAPTASSAFSAVPTFGNPFTIRSTTQTASEETIDDTFSIYYGVSATSNLDIGTYKMIPDSNNSDADGAIVYYVTMADECTTPATLYDKVASMSKGTQTVAELRAAITVPTSADRTKDTSNSGVYEYDASVFGEPSDASNDYPVYYYRGVLENEVGSYGSDGSAVTYPNYVILDADDTRDTSDTCWRIVRTTGSGGVKMIYNGKWTGSTCANRRNTLLSTSTFSVDSNKYYGSAFGYTQNSSYNSSNTSATYSTMFGSNTDFSVNSTSSGIKTNIETWFSGTNGVSAYESNLESSAGYCNDRTLYLSETATTPISDNATVSSSTYYYAGAYIRNATTTESPSLTCPRGTADLYTTSSASDGNKQLSKPAALLTADEAAFAGSGRSSSTTPYHANAYLSFSEDFWLLSPISRSANGVATTFYMYRYGGFLNTGAALSNNFGVRPAISLNPGSVAASGSGTATDPWVVTNTYTIHFDANGGSGTMADQTSGTTINTNTFTAPDGYLFNGWNTEADGTGISDAAGVTFPAPAGGSITLYAQWRKTVGTCASGGVPGYICYDGNGADAGEMPNQSASANATVMLRAYNYKRDGYAFLGWSTVKNPTIGTDTIYGPMEDIATPSTMATTGLTLYAVWLPKSTTYTMQNFSSTTCSSQLTQITYNSSTTTFTVSPNSFIALGDARDNNVYAVARLSDGNCWMLENLRLDENATSVNSLSQGVGGSFTKLAASEDSNFSNSTTANNLYSTGNAYTMPRYNRNNTYIDGTNSAGTKLTPSYNGNNNSSQWYGYGNYYTWAAAKANTTAMTNASTSNSTATSICPANWRLPIGNSTATYSFGALSTSMGGLSSGMSSSTNPTAAVMSARLRHFPNNFVYSGHWYSAQANYRSTYGYYWSSTASSSGRAYYLYFHNSYVYPGTNYLNKYYGLSVRCVAGS